MIAVDTNILVYAHNRESPWYQVASSAVAGLAEGRASWAIPWPCVHEFLAVTTNPRVFPRSKPTDSIAQIEAWMESPSLRLIGEIGEYWEELKSTFLLGKLHGAQVHDARIHAICLAHGVRTLYSADRDFSRMQGLKIMNPCLP